MLFAQTLSCFSKAFCTFCIQAASWYNIIHRRSRQQFHFIIVSHHLATPSLKTLLLVLLPVKACLVCYVDVFAPCFCLPILHLFSSLSHIILPFLNLRRFYWCCSLSELLWYVKLMFSWCVFLMCFLDVFVYVSSGEDRRDSASGKGNFTHIASSSVVIESTTMNINII